VALLWSSVLAIINPPLPMRILLHCRADRKIGFCTALGGQINADSKKAGTLT